MVLGSGRGSVAEVRLSKKGHEMNFEECHAQVDADPVRELMRRRQYWASAPGSRGDALKPSAAIVPLATINDAIVELLERRKHAGVPGTDALIEQFADL